MKQKLFFLIALVIIAFGAYVALRGAGQDGGTTGAVAEKKDLIRVTSPRIGETVSSPLRITGEARGKWFFEASFPVRILDENGKELAVTPAQAHGEWMTEDFVPFEAELLFDSKESSAGTLILEKDNPSGLPEHADSLSIPIRFRK